MISDQCFADGPLAVQFSDSISTQGPEGSDHLILISAMIPFNLQKWMPLFLRLHEFCPRLIFHRGTQETVHDLKSPLHEIPPTSDQPRTALYPFTWNEMQIKIKEFIRLIDEEGVVRLASRHNGDKHCDIFRRENGDFNVCFFVHFPADNVRWVVRIPIVSVIQDCRLKIQSEIVTMLYVQQKTSIPVPHVYAHGESTSLVKGSTIPFMIIDCIPGRSLNKDVYLNATNEQRKRLYQDLIKTMSELRRLEFSTAGSLLSNADNASLPVIGSALSIPANELQRYGRGYEDAGPFSTATQFIAYRYRILSETYRLPTVDSTLKSIMSELFALNSISEQIPKFLKLQWDKGPFILAHQDLRHDNIIVDEEFRIQGIIDWEFTGPIPRQLFTPPPWITGHDGDGMDESQRNSLSSDFYVVLEEASKSCIDTARLKKDWDAQQTVSLAMAQILRRPSCLEKVYYKFIFPTLFNADADQVISEACQSSSLLTEANKRLGESKRYTQYLSERGLLNEQDPRIKEFLEKAAALRKRIDAMK